MTVVAHAVLFPSFHAWLGAGRTLGLSKRAAAT
jgi:hypothetical protein